MAIRASCPHCGKGLTLKRQQAGVRVLCPTCGGRVSVPAADTAICARPETIRREAPAARTPPAKTRPVVVPPSVINYRVVGAVGAGALVLVAGLVAGGATLLKRSPRAAEPVAAVVDPQVETTEETLLPLPTDEPAHLPALAATDPLTQLSEAAPAMEVKEPPAAREIVRRQRQNVSDESLRKDLLRVPELKLNPDPQIGEAAETFPRKPGRKEESERLPRGVRSTADLFALARRSDQPAHPTVVALEARPDLTGLQFRRGADCQLGKEPAENLQLFSRQIRTVLATSQARNATPETVADELRRSISSSTGLRKSENGRGTDFAESIIPTMMQMLCAENQPIRLVMVEHLDKVEHRSASEALAKMAVFDLSEKIRAEAVRALTARPKSEYRHILLAGLRYPWAPAADHAAEALVALQDREAVSSLKTLAEMADPLKPYFDQSKHTYVVNEVVRINHLSNCAMCHAPSLSTNDLVRGRVPTPGQPLPPPIQYYGGDDGIFVRADVTYLKQDFSVFQPVDRPSQWPTMQRFDYLLRTRSVPTEQAEAMIKMAERYPTYPQREAVLYALKELETDLTPRKEQVTIGSIQP